MISERQENTRVGVWCVCVCVCALMIASDPTITHTALEVLKNISVHSAYSWKIRQLSGDGPPTQRESTTSAQIALEVEFLANIIPTDGSPYLHHRIEV